MNFFKRMVMVLKSYFHSFLDKVEDPEKLLDQALMDMEQNYRRSKVELAKAIADEKRMVKQIKQNQEMAKQWAQKAVLAVKKGDDDLAREALKRKKNYEQVSDEFEEFWKQQKELTESLKNSLKELKDRIDKARFKRRQLVSRRQRAELQKRISESLQAFKSPGALFSRVEEEINRLEAESAAIESLDMDSVESKFAKLEQHEAIEQELSSIKQKHLPESK